MLVLGVPGDVVHVVLGVHVVLSVPAQKPTCDQLLVGSFCTVGWTTDATDAQHSHQSMRRTYNWGKSETFLHLIGEN